MNKVVIKSGRTKFANEIIAEFWKPSKESARAVIICDGAPGLRTKRELAEFYARKGYWVFQFRYRGTWESKGEFLKLSPTEDVDEVIKGLRRKFTEMWTGTVYHPKIVDVVVIGASFGGPAAILATRNPLVRKAIAIAPVVNWRKFTKTEFAEELRQFTEGFPGAYRCPRKNFDKLLAKKFYNPVDWVESLDGKKIFLVHARDDDTVPFMPTRKFAKQIGATYIERARGGHLGSNTVMDAAIWKRVNTFLKKSE